MSDLSKELVGLLVQAVSKGVMDRSEVEGDGIPMRARGEYVERQSYSRGDVVSIPAVGLFVAVKTTSRDPRESGTDNWVPLLAYTSAGGGTASPAITNFLQLLDTPNAFTGAAGLGVVVNATETALEFAAISGAGVTVALTPPAAPISGTLWYHSGINQLLLWDGTVWGAV